MVIIILSVFFLNPKNSFFSTNQNSALPILTDNNETVGKKTKNHFVNTNSDSKEKSDNNAVNQSATNIIEEKNTAKREIRGDETGLKSRSVLKKRLQTTPLKKLQRK